MNGVIQSEYMKLVIVSGMAATGKTSVARRLSERLGYAFYSKDIIKEALFDERPQPTWRHGWYEQQAKERLFQVVERCVRQRKSVIIETNFVPADRRRLRTFLRQRHVKVVEIYCYSRGLTNFRRFVRRNESGQRHKGHHDRLFAYIPVLAQATWSYAGVRWKNRPLRLSPHVKLLDTTDITKLDYGRLERYIKSI